MVTSTLVAGSDKQTRGPARDFDGYSKTAVQHGLAELFAWAQVDIDTADLTAEPVDLHAGTHRADLVYSTVTGVVVHLEIQQVADVTMGRRMTSYATRIMTAPRFAARITDLLQILVQVSGPPMPTTFRLGGLSNTARLIHLPTIPADLLLTTPALSPFALTRGDPELVRPVVRSIGSLDDGDLRTSLTTLALYLASHLRATLVQELRRTGMIDTIPEMIDELRDTEIGATFRQQGRQEGRLAAVVDILAARFPAADVETLTRTALWLLDAQDTHAVRAALDLEAL